MAKYESVFSEFEIKNASIKFTDSETYTKLGCVGSADDELEVKVVTKSCEGVVVKSVARGAGSGTLNMSLHMNYSLYVEALGMEQEGLKTGVVAYGKNSRHKEFSLVAEIFDEDGVKKFIDYGPFIVQYEGEYGIQSSEGKKLYAGTDEAFLSG